MEWNDALAATFFRPELAGRPVFLYVDQRLIESLSGGEPLDQFVSTVLAGPPWVGQRLGFCQKAFQAFVGWRERNLEYPPYIAFLALFVLAVGVTGKFPAYAYYPRLWKLLGEQDLTQGTPRSFDRMLALWEDLELWSNRDRSGQMGVFSIRIVGKWIHVGLPKAQAVLTEAERRELIQIFSSAGFDPNEPPNELEMASGLRQFGAGILRPATIALLRDPASEPELYSVLLDIARTELENWDGVDAGSPGLLRYLAFARICLRIDEPSQRVAATLRVPTNPDFPEAGLQLKSVGNLSTYHCEESLPGWSTVMRSDSDQRDLDAAALDWARGEQFVDEGSHWYIRLPGRRLRIFVTGRSFQLPGLIELRQLPRAERFVIAAKQELWPTLESWSETGKPVLKRLKIESGIPLNWALFASEGIQDDSSIRGVIPELALASVVRLRLRGGVKSSAGNTYFSFALPRIELVGGGEESTVWAADLKLRAAEPNSYELPARLPVRLPIAIEARSQEQVVSKITIFVDDDVAWRCPKPLVYSDAFGINIGPAIAQQEEVAPRISGALTTATSNSRLRVQVELPKHNQFYVVGQRIGEIADGAATEDVENLGWLPVWLLDKRAASVEFCGRDILTSAPLPALGTDRPSIRHWREVIWTRRMRFTSPKRKRVAQLWRHYLEAARDAHW